MTSYFLHHKRKISYYPLDIIYKNTSRKCYKSYTYFPHGFEKREIPCRNLHPILSMDLIHN